MSKMYLDTSPVDVNLGVVKVTDKFVDDNVNWIQDLFENVAYEIPGMPVRISEVSLDIFPTHSGSLMLTVLPVWSEVMPMVSCLSASVFENPLKSLFSISNFLTASLKIL